MFIATLSACKWIHHEISSPVRAFGAQKVVNIYYSSYLSAAAAALSRLIGKPSGFNLARLSPSRASGRRQFGRRAGTDKRRSNWIGGRAHPLRGLVAGEMMF